MSTFFDCPGAYENLAGTGDVCVTMRTQLVPAGDSASTAYTEISAYARSKTGDSTAHQVNDVPDQHTYRTCAAPLRGETPFSSKASTANQ